MTAHPHTTRHHRRAAARGMRVLVLAGLAAGLAVPAGAQEETDDSRPAADAVARLDFPAALEELDALIEADPAAPGPRLARADLHVRMQRPALAIADLDAVLAQDPANTDALAARADILAGAGALERARADLSAALQSRADDPGLLARRAAINAATGRTAAALADYDAALALTPDNATLTEARAALMSAAQDRAAADVIFGEEAVMSEEFRIDLGPTDAVNRLHIVHASTDLDADAGALDPGFIDRAVAAGALSVVHLFTYTGAEASIWGNLGLICAGPDGYAATHAALSDASGQAAIDAAGNGDTAPLARLLTAAYSVAGVDEALVESCALDRLTATRYLSDWQSHRDAGAWRGVNLLDSWPTWVLNGKPIGPATLAAQLAEMAPAPAPAAADDTADETTDPGTAPDANPVVADAPSETSAEPDMASAAVEEPPADTPETADQPATEQLASTQTAQTAPAPGTAPDANAELGAAPSETPAEAETASTDAAPPPADTTETADQPAETGQPDSTQSAALSNDEAPGPDLATGPADEEAVVQTGAAAAPAAADAPEATPAEAPTDPEVAEDAAAPAPGSDDAPDPAVASDTPPETTPDTADAPLAQVRFPTRPEPVDNARVPVDLRGVYASSLAGCISYLDAIESPDRIDAVLPAINPLDGPVLGTILVTSRRVYPFNPADTECAIAGDEGSGDAWQGQFNCQSPLAPETSTDLRLAPAGADGTAPRISASYGAAGATELRQCRTLGQLGNIFAPLWTGDDGACTVSAPLERGRFDFSVDGTGDLVLRVVPATLTAEAGRADLHAVVDGAATGSAGRWDGTGWQLSLGGFDAAAESLGWGMFLDIRAAGGVFEARLPLFGSSAAMDRLAACTPTRE